ncbi:MAG: hypothetical protein ACI4HI_13940 [Lachnospiraceae bacterium]
MEKPGRKEQMEKALELYNSGCNLSEIAEKLCVTVRTVSNWKKKGNWPPCERGGPKGNQKAKGGRGNPHPNPPPDQTKHGAYSGIYWNTLSEEEKKMLEELNTSDTEIMLIDQIRLCHVREHRIMEAVNQCKEELKFKPTSSNAESLVNAMMRLEQELSSVQNRKTKAIDSMARIAEERKKEERENSVGSAIDQWIEAVKQAEKEEKEMKEDREDGDERE